MNSEQWIDKLCTLQELARIKPKTPYHLFGADTHRFRLRKPLDQHKLEKFEKRHRVILPEDYRLFLTTVSDGGPGPNHGILRLSESEQLLPANTRDFLRRDFPHRAPWNNDIIDFVPEQFLCHNLVDGYFDDYHKQGCLPISSVGCGEYTLLVVAGPEYGNIWEDQRVNGGGIWPTIAADGTHQSFKNWIMRWVEETSAYIKSRIDDKT